MDLKQYEQNEKKRLNIAIKHLESGVNIVDIHSVYIDEDVKIGEGTAIGSCVTIEGQTVIGKNCFIGQNTRIVDSSIGDGTDIQSSVILESSVGEMTHVGPFAYIRPGSMVGDNCKIGDFVEVKNASFGDGSKSAHLTYIGDADVGEGVNIGCGVVFVNYDGSKKYRSRIGDDVFIGCNTNLVSPVDVKDGAYIAAGTTVTEDIPDGALSIGRSRQRNIEGWADKKVLYPRKSKK